MRRRRSGVQETHKAFAKGEDTLLFLDAVS